MKWQYSRNLLCNSTRFVTRCVVISEIGTRWEKDSNFKCRLRFAHLVESVDVGNLEADEVQQRLSDHIVELERETGNCVRLHSIP